MLSIGFQLASGRSLLTVMIRNIVGSETELGESPLWIAEEQALYWIDVLGSSLKRLNLPHRTVDTWPLPKIVGAIARRARGGFLVSFRTGFAFLERPGAPLDWLEVSGLQLERGRFNDGKCDRLGRFWVGTLDRKLTDPVGELYRIDAGLACRTMDTGFTLSNGLGWSPDNRTMYFTDSRAKLIYAYDFELESGSLSNRRVFVDYGNSDGRPDGLTVDADGHLWVAAIGGWRVDRFSPDGRLDRSVRLPVSQPTSCTFGGPDLETLYVTTARMNLDAVALAEEPLAGSVFALEVGVRGLAEPAFAG